MVSGVVSSEDWQPTLRPPCRGHVTAREPTAHSPLEGRAPVTKTAFRGAWLSLTEGQVAVRLGLCLALLTPDEDPGMSTRGRQMGTCCSFDLKCGEAFEGQLDTPA